MKRRTVLVGGTTVVLGALAGCLGDDDDTSTEEEEDGPDEETDPGDGEDEPDTDDEAVEAELISVPDPETSEDGGVVMLNIEVADPPTEIEVIVRPLDDNGEVLGEHVSTETIEEEETVYGLAIDDVPPDVTVWEYEVNPI